MISRGRNREKNIAIVEAEFGEPLKDIIIGLREQGNKWSTVAGAMDIQILTLLRWRRLLGLEVDPMKRLYTSRDKDMNER